jgi:hypothetical protein
MFLRNADEISLKRALDDDEDPDEPSKKPRIESLLDDIK